MSTETNGQRDSLDRQLAAAVSSVARALLLRMRRTGSMAKGCTHTWGAPLIYLQDCVLQVALTVRPPTEEERHVTAAFGASGSYPAMDDFLSVLVKPPGRGKGRSRPSSPDPS